MISSIHSQTGVCLTQNTEDLSGQSIACLQKMWKFVNFDTIHRIMTNSHDSTTKLFQNHDLPYTVRQHNSFWIVTKCAQIRKHTHKAGSTPWKIFQFLRVDSIVCSTENERLTINHAAYESIPSPCRVDYVLHRACHAPDDLVRLPPLSSVCFVHNWGMFHFCENSRPSHEHASFLRDWKTFSWQGRCFSSSTLRTSFLCDWKTCCEKEDLSIQTPLCTPHSCVIAKSNMKEGNFPFKHLLAYLISTRLRGIPDQTRCWLCTERQIIAQACHPSAWQKLHRAWADAPLSLRPRYVPFTFSFFVIEKHNFEVTYCLKKNRAPDLCICTLPFCVIGRCTLQGSCPSLVKEHSSFINTAFLNGECIRCRNRADVQLYLHLEAPQKFINILLHVLHKSKMISNLGIATSFTASFMHAHNHLLHTSK